MKNALRALVLTSLLCIPFMGTSCNGPFHAFNGVSEWNEGLTGQRFLDEVIFWGLWIIPVYQFSILGDLIIFNPVQFWTGNNPLGPPGDTL